MYRCDVCKEVTPAGTKQRRVTEKTREARYAYRPKANRVRRAGKKKVQMKDDPGGLGQEITSELSLCPRCHANYVELLNERDEAA